MSSYMALTPEMLEELVKGCKTPKDVESLYSQMLQHMINRSLEAEMQAHLGYERHDAAAMARAGIAATARASRWCRAQ